jgi:hypothetical protein
LLPNCATPATPVFLKPKNLALEYTILWNPSHNKKKDTKILTIKKEEKRKRRFLVNTKSPRQKRRGRTYSF